MRKDRLIITNILVILVIIALLAGGAYFYYQNENFVKTDDAKVSADMDQMGSTSFWYAQRIGY